MPQTLNGKNNIWFPFNTPIAGESSVEVISAKGIYLRARINGQKKKIIDGTSSWWLNLHGHSNSYFVRAISRQLRKLQQISLGNFYYNDLAELTRNLLHKINLKKPEVFNRVFFSDNGSTAVEVALKMAIQCHQLKNPRKKIRIFALKNGYHGDTFGAMAVSARGIFTKAFRSWLFPVTFLDIHTNDILQKLKADGKNFASIFIYEPLLQGAGGMLLHSPHRLDQILAYCQKNDIITIADEVLTGFYRTGKFLASFELENHSNIICLSKAITGGNLPMGVTVADYKITRIFEENSAIFYHGHSYSGNALACAAALANFKLIEKKTFQENLRAICQRQLEFSYELAQNPICVNTRCLGSVLAFEINHTGRADYLNSIKNLIFQNALQKGLYLRPLGNTVYFMPPLSIKLKQLEKVYQIIRRVLLEISAST